MLRNMKFAVTMLTVAALTQSAMALAGTQSTDSRAKPSSFVPHPHTSSHVYGTPIHPAVVGHTSVSRHKQTPKKRAPSAKK
jgi:hypothetical protein